MNTLTQTQADLIDAVILEKRAGRLTAAILEKDIHVTEALRAIFTINIPNIELMFCGGTSLSKGYALIDRMSEDVDIIKMVLPRTQTLSRNAVRKRLKALKASIEVAMEGSGYQKNEVGSFTRNEYRYFSNDWEHVPRYKTDASIRAHLKLEFTLRTPNYPTHVIPIITLAEKFAGLPGKLLKVACVAVEETLAEKVLSFLRRHAEHRAGDAIRKWDKRLVRHIYDIYCIASIDPSYTEKAKAHFGKLVSMEVSEFSQHAHFCIDPKACMTKTLKLASGEQRTRGEYEEKLLPLVYGNVVPSFDEAFSRFADTSRSLLSTL